MNLILADTLHPEPDPWPYATVASLAMVVWFLCR
jgi:hypothetical protein